MVSLPRSITLRLSLLYAASTLAVLSVCGVALYFYLVHSFNYEDSQFLIAKVHELHADLADDGHRTRRLVKEIHTETESTRFRDYEARLLLAQSKVLGETPGMAAHLPGTDFPAAQPYRQFTNGPRIARVNRRGHYLLAAIDLGANATTGQPVILQLAMNVAHDRAVLADYRNMLIVVLAVGTLLAVLLSIVAARKGLAPMRALSRVVANLSIEQPNRDALRQQSWPREISGLADTLDRVLDRLARSFERLRQFSADVAHELRTPLGNLRNEAEIALSRTRDEQDYRRTVESMLEETLRLERIVDSLLFLARAEQDRAPHLHKAIALDEIAASVVEYYAPLAEQQGVALHARGAARAHGDDDLLRRAVANLVANAIRHTPAGGRIVVEVVPGETAAIRVIDNGSGIAPEHLHRVFDRFYRADESRTDSVQGSGLGLAIVDSIMKLHNGRVSIESDLAQGTTVSLTWPTA